MNGTKRRTSLVAVALTAVIGAGAVWQTLAVASTAPVSLPVSGSFASEPAYAVRLIDPVSLVAAFNDEAAATVGFASQATYADIPREGMVNGGASFAHELVAAPRFDLATLGAAVSAPPATFSDTATYAGSLRAAHLGSGAGTFQLAGGAATIALFDLEGIAAAFSDDDAEDVTFAGESPYAGGLSDAYLGAGFGGETFSDQAAIAAPPLDLAALAGAATGAAATGATFADEATYAGTLRDAYLGAEFGNAAFSETMDAAWSPIELTTVAAAFGGAEAAAPSFADQATYAGSLRAANLGAGASFSNEAGVVSPLFALDTLADAVSGSE